MSMSEERMVVVKKHIARLERLIRFYHPDSVTESGKLISSETLVGVLAEMLTCIDELTDQIKELERLDDGMAESMTDQYDEIVKITRPALESIINRISRIEREVAELKRR